MTNLYRKLFYSFLILINIALFTTSVILGIKLNNKIPSIILGFFTIYTINATLALWISTSNVRIVYTKLAWLLSFFVFPIISTIIYLIWGRMPYYKKGVTDYKDKYKRYINLYDSSSLTNKENIDSFDLIAKYAYTTRNSDIFYNNNIEVLEDNTDFFAKTMELIQSSKKSILMNYYIVSDGVFWDAVAKKLIQKAKEGVQIYLLFDRYGSNKKITPTMVANLLQYPNIHIAKFESDRDVWTRSANNFRSHKKMLVIDNEIALYGGSNLSDEYIGIKEKTPNWSDLNFIVKGAIVKSFIIDYCIDWDFNSFLPFIWKMGDFINCYKAIKFFIWFKSLFFLPKKKQLFYQAIKNRSTSKNLLDKLEALGYFKNKEASEVNDNNKAVFFQTGPRYYNNIVSDVLITSILNAKKSVKIISPYLQLNESLQSALVSASHRQIDIQIIVPGNCDDKWFLLEMNHSNYLPLLDAKISIYEYVGFIHSKLIIIDDEYIITGTYNLDFRSFNSNFESLFIVKNQNVTNQTLNYWNNSLKSVQQISKFKYIDGKKFKSLFIQTGLQIIQPLL